MIGRNLRLNPGMLTQCDVNSLLLLFFKPSIHIFTAIVSVRIFTTSQSAEAHLILFKRIFEIATLDTNIPVHFHHIHGDGFLVWIADAHKGQALGEFKAQPSIALSLGCV